jgi:hypothetical protein
MELTINDQSRQAEAKQPCEEYQNIVDAHATSNTLGAGNQSNCQEKSCDDLDGDCIRRHPSSPSMIEPVTCQRHGVQRSNVRTASLLRDGTSTGEGMERAREHGKNAPLDELDDEGLKEDLV